MKIGLLIYGSLDTLSGGYLYDRMLVEYLRGRGDTVEIISLPPGMSGSSDWRIYAAHLGDNLNFRLPPGLDILIEDELNHPSLLAANARPHSYPVISLVHHLRSSELRARWQNAFFRVVEKHYLGSVDGFIFNSKTTKNVVNNLVGENVPSLVAYPPTDRFGAALPEVLVSARAAQPGPLRIVFLGNVIPRKGLHTLLDVMTDTELEFSLDVIGSLTTDPVYVREIQQKAKVQDLDTRVNFHGSLDKTDLVEKLTSAHLLIVPSSYEGFGIVYLEGMAFGLPAIGSAAGAASEIIQDGVNGYLIAPGDANALASRLNALAADRSQLARMSLAALERYRQQPRWHQTAENIRCFLQSLI